MRPIIAMALALFGIKLSKYWERLGTRQIKFHNYLQYVSEQAWCELHTDQAKEAYALYWVRKLQRSDQNDSKLNEEHRLTDEEKSSSARESLRLVPRLFTYAYSVLSIGGLLSLVYGFMKLSKLI